jgi:hypothetical protein
LSFFVFIGVFSFAQKNPRNIEVDWKTDTTKTTIPLEECTALMQPDGIPPIDDPKFLSIKEAKKIGSVTAFEPIVNDNKLTFKKKKGKFIDNETKSVWDITGKCIEGELKGESLYPIIHGNHFAFAWFAFQPECEVYE